MNTLHFPTTHILPFSGFLCILVQLNFKAFAIYIVIEIQLYKNHVVSYRYISTGFYQFCCEGVYCPDCPLELNISTLEQNVTLNLALNCVNTSFIATFNTERQPGNFTVKVISQTCFFSISVAANELGMVIRIFGSNIQNNLSIPIGIMVKKKKSMKKVITNFCRLSPVSVA